MRKKIFLYLILALVPLCISSLFLMLRTPAQSLLTAMPAWNDEDFYYNQIKSVLMYGHPLGYYGYEGSHAMFGNFGAHGFIIMIPYVIFCGIFGLRLNSITLLNNILLCISVLVYELLFKPSCKKVILFIMLISSPMVVFYTNTSMMEAEQYFFAITIALMMVYLDKNQKKKGIKILLTASVFFAILCRITWSVLLFPLILILIRNAKKIPNIVKWILAGAGSVTGCIIGYIISHLFSAPYFTGGYIMEAYIAALKTGISMQKLKNLIEIACDGVIYALQHFDAIWMNVSRDYVIAIGIIALVYWIANRKKEMSYIPIIVLGGFAAGIFGFYCGGAIAIRHLYPAALFAVVYIFASLKNEKMKYAIYVIIAAFAVCTFVLQTEQAYDGRDSWNTKEQQEFYADIRVHMNELEIIQNTSNPWDNTIGISLHNYPDRIYELFLPAGMGINYYMYFPEEKEKIPRYFMITGEEEDISELKKLGYYKVDEFYDIVVMKRN